MNNFISSIIQSVCSMVSNLVLLRLGLLSLGLRFFTTLVINELFRTYLALQNMRLVYRLCEKTQNRLDPP